MEIKGIIYYTNNIVNSHIMKLCQEYISKSGLPIVSCSLKPIDFGKNIVLDLQSSVLTMNIQILTALENINTKYVFFCEHDVLYHKTHFDFIPEDPNVFYYNTNLWNLEWGNGRITTFDNLRALSQVCVSREKAIEHYTKRIKTIKDNNWDLIPGKNPRWARTIGFEPGKPTRNGGISDDVIINWRSEYSNLNIRHAKNLTKAQLTLEQFNRKPVNFRESTVDKLEGWTLVF